MPKKQEKKFVIKVFVGDDASNYLWFSGTDADTGKYIFTDIRHQAMTFIEVVDLNRKIDELNQHFRLTSVNQEAVTQRI